MKKPKLGGVLIGKCPTLIQSPCLPFAQLEQLLVTFCKMASNENIMTLLFYTYVTLKMLYARDSVMMSMYNITENIL